MKVEPSIKSWRVIQPTQIKNTLLIADSIREVLDRNQIIPEEVAQLGCGSGALLITLEKILTESDRLTGYENSVLAANAAKAFMTDRLRFLQRDFTKLGDHAWYDLLLVMNVLEHLEDYEDFLDRIRVKGRYTMFLIPLKSKPGKMKTQVNNPPKHHFDESSIMQNIADMGFGIRDKMYIHLRPTNWQVRDNIIYDLRSIVYKIAPKFARRFYPHALLLLTKNGEGTVKMK